jgi:hypothetical protein
MILADALSSCFKNDFDYCGQTYESIVWKHIPEKVYDELSIDEKSNFTLNESSNIYDSYALKQIVLSDGDVSFDTLKTREEYEMLSDDVKPNFHPVYRMYSKNPIPLQEIEVAYSKYTNETKPMIVLRMKRDTLLKETDKYTIPDWSHPTPEDKQAWLDYRQILRDLPTLVTPIDDGSLKVWVTNESVETLQVGDRLTTSHIPGYFTKGEPAVVTIREPCDFSESTVETYYSNVNVTQTNVVNMSETEQPGYVENAYWTSNVVLYYTGDVISHFTNVVVYDNISIYSNVDVDEYSNLTVEQQSLYTPVMVSNTSPVEVEGYTPVLEYSNVSSDEYDANVHVDYTKIVTHYSNITTVDVVTHSNIEVGVYNNLETNYVVTHGYTYFSNLTSNINVLEYAALTPEERVDYVVNVVEPVTSNLQSHYTPQTRVVPHQIRYLDASGVENTVWKAAYVSATLV